MVLDELAAFEQTASQGAGGMGEAFGLPEKRNHLENPEDGFIQVAKHMYATWMEKWFQPS